MDTGKRLAATITRPIYLLSGLIFLALVGTNLFVLVHAGSEAHEIRERVERSLVANEIHRQRDQMAHEQSRISYLDDTVEAIRNDIDQTFLREKIAELLWEDFGIQYSIIVSPDFNARAFVFEYAIEAPSKADAIIDENADLVSLAQQRYMDNRIAGDDGGFKLASHPMAAGAALPVMAFRKFHGVLGLVAAQAIAPHDTGTNPDGRPHTLLTFKPLSLESLTKTSDYLGLGQIEVLHQDHAKSAGQQLVLPDDAGHAQYVAHWTIASPWSEIWNASTAILGAIVLFSGIGLWIVSARHGKALLELHQSEEKNRFMALHDGLTGLANRTQFDEQLGEAVTEGGRARRAVLCIDLDKFKAVNDTYGHAAGDVVIQTAARRIAGCVGDRGLVARVGGDEFVALVWNDLSGAQLRLLGELIVEQLGFAIAVDGGDAKIGGSVGIACWPDQAGDAKELMRRADLALYRAKSLGRGNVQFFRDELEETAANAASADAA